MKALISNGLVMVCCLVALAGCGRDAPEGAAADPVDGVEPDVAGIEVISDDPVVVPTPTSSTTAPVPTTVVQAAGSYVVQSGDTLSVIAERFGVSIDALSQANQITDVNTIRPGQELIIPAG